MSDKNQMSNKILYVDDNVTMLDLIKLLLEQADTRADSPECG